MWTPKSCSTVATAALAPPYEYAPSIFAEPPVERWTKRSRGIDSIVTCLVDGTTRTRIIDCVRTWSALNFESSSEPSRRTVNAPVTALGEGFCGDGDSKMSVGEGVGTVMTWPADSIANCAAGRKYASPPATDERVMASKTRKLVRSGLSRRREALMRCPGLRPRGTGEHSRPWGGIAL